LDGSPESGRGGRFANKPVAAGARFCPVCGAPQALNCTQCNRELAPGARFCPECGTKVP